jgi:F-type H+-transporting ATPase subunit delta
MKVSIKQYSQTLFELTDGKSEQEILNIVSKFAEQLKNDGQLKNSDKIIEKFAEIYNAKNGIVQACVISARALEDVQVAEISDFIKKKYAVKDVVVDNIVDEKIKGGLIIRVGDEIMDASILSQLKKLKNILSK